MAVPARKLRQLPSAPAPSRRPPARRPAIRRVPPTGAPRGRPASSPRTRPAPRARRRMPFLLFSLAVITTMVLVLVSAHALVAQEAFRVAELAQRAEELEQGHGRLRLRVAELTSPERLVRAARRAGLVLPDRVEILELLPEKDGAGSPGASEVAPPGSGAVLALEGSEEG